MFSFRPQYHVVMRQHCVTNYETISVKIFLNDLSETVFILTVITPISSFPVTFLFEIVIE